MKITHAILRSAVHELGSSSLKANNGWELDFANGVLTAIRLDRDEEPFVIPESQILYMRCPREAPKAAKKAA